MARSKTYPRDVRERAVALVFEQVKTGQRGSQWEAICSVAATIRPRALRGGVAGATWHVTIVRVPRGASAVVGELSLTRSVAACDGCDLPFRAVGCHQVSGRISVFCTGFVPAVVPPR